MIIKKRRQMVKVPVFCCLIAWTTSTTNRYHAANLVICLWQPKVGLSRPCKDPIKPTAFVKAKNTAALLWHRLSFCHRKASDAQISPHISSRQGNITEWSRIRLTISGKGLKLMKFPATFTNSKHRPISGRARGQRHANSIIMHSNSFAIMIISW